MIRQDNQSDQQGFNLVEAILSVAIFALLLTALVGAWLYGQESSMLAGQRARAVFLAEEGLEAVRNIRDSGFANLTDGTYGLVISGGSWILSGSSDVTDIFTRQIIVATIDADRKSVISKVTWKQNYQRGGLVSLDSRLTYWQYSVPSISTCAQYCQGLGGFSSGVCRQSAAQCKRRTEQYQAGGDVYCTINPNKACCCVF